MCGIVGVYNVPRAATVAEQGLEALVNRGQDATGIAMLDPAQEQFVTLTGEGENGVPQRAYRSENGELKAEIARHTGGVVLGQNRYSTNGNHNGHVQPTSENGSTLTLIHNGNLSHTDELDAELAAVFKREIERQEIDLAQANDTKRISLLVGRYMEKNGDSLETAMRKVYQLIRDNGSFCVVAADAKTGTMVAMRDRRGIRPMVVARKDGGYVVASETSSLQAMGVNVTIENEGAREDEDFVWRTVEAAEMLVFDENGMRSAILEDDADREEALDAVEFVYLANEGSILYGRRVRDIRKKLGKKLTDEHPPTKESRENSIVVGVPSTALPFAEGFAEQSGLPMVGAVTISKESDGVRSFMLPDSQRAAGAKKKFEVDPGLVEGKVVYIVDDSVFRGTVQTALIQKLREAGAAEVRVRIGSPPVRWPNNLGVATKKAEELVARDGRTNGQIAARIKADSIAYLSTESMRQIIGRPLTAPDFTGENPIERYRGERAAKLPAFAP